MPPRAVTAAIVLFWLATSGWYFYREFWPELQAGEAPPYTIDLVDETHQLPNYWDVFQGEKKEKKVGKANTQINYHKEDDSFELYNKLDLKFEIAGLGDNLKTDVTSITTYRITRAGNLRGLSADLTGSFRLDSSGVEFSPRGQVTGSVRGGRLYAEGDVVLLGHKQALQFDPVELSGHGTVLNPLHPVKRIAGLKPGQTWQVHLFDPLALLSGARLAGGEKNANPLLQLALQAIGGNEPGQFTRLTATVLSEPQPLDWDGRPVPCLVVEYRGGRDMTARTWVRRDDAVVLQQEASFKGDRMLLKRATFK
jgi:hypothetical protein